MTIKTVDVVALVITATVSIILVATVIGAAVSGRPLSDNKAELVGNLVSSFIAIVSMYVGSKIRAE